MADRITKKMLNTKAARVSEHVCVELRVEHIYSQGYRITNSTESINLSQVGTASEIWNWLDAFEKGYDFAYGVFKIGGERVKSPAEVINTAVESMV